MYPQRAASRRRRLSVSAVPRLPRSRLPPHGIYHVTTRGVARTPIFRDDADRVLFLRLLEVAGRGTGWDVHALCLMGNHYHLVVETGLDRLSAAMHRVNGRYAENFNARYDRSGRLFGDRFAARVIEDEVTSPRRAATLPPTRSERDCARPQPTGRGPEPATASPTTGSTRSAS